MFFLSIFFIVVKGFILETVCPSGFVPGGFVLEGFVCIPFKLNQWKVALWFCISLDRIESV